MTDIALFLTSLLMQQSIPYPSCCYCKCLIILAPELGKEMTKNIDASMGFKPVQ